MSSKGDNTIDLLGINYYQPRRIKAKENPADIDPNCPMPEDYFDYYDMPNKKMNPYRGWEIYEKGIYDILINVRDHYGNIPCYISENGMGVEGEMPLCPYALMPLSMKGTIFIPFPSFHFILFDSFVLILKS